jgi:tRNA uridine 5-carbamoylmethylation protein Kti12
MDSSMNIPRTTRLIIVTGLPATGKSTLARRLTYDSGSADAAESALLAQVYRWLRRPP